MQNRGQVLVAADSSTLKSKVFDTLQTHIPSIIVNVVVSVCSVTVGWYLNSQVHADPKNATIASGLIAAAVVLFLVLILALIHAWRRILREPYSEYYLNEGEALIKLKKLLKDPEIDEIRILGLANTSIFSCFSRYFEFLTKSNRISVLSLSYLADNVISDLDASVSSSASELFPQLLAHLDRIDISDERKSQIREYLRECPQDRAIENMIHASTLLWCALAHKISEFKSSFSAFIDIRSYSSIPDFKGWILGGKYLLRGNFVNPGMGISEPVTLHKSKKGRNDISNFSLRFEHMFKNAMRISNDTGVTLAKNPYDKNRGNFYETTGRKCIDRIIDLAKYDKNLRILDVGCGTGYWSLEFARQLDETCLIFAIDSDSALIEGLRGTLFNLGDGRRPPCEIRPIAKSVSNLTDKDVPPATINVALLRHSFHHISDPNQAIQSIKKTLAEHAVVYVIEICAPKSESRNGMRASEGSLNTYINRVAKLSNKQNFKYYTEQELLEGFRNNGFDTEVLQKESGDFICKLSDYRRRCSSPESWSNLYALETLLLGASDRTKAFFKIQGTNIDTLEFALPEVLIKAVPKKHIAN